MAEIGPYKQLLKDSGGFAKFIEECQSESEKEHASKDEEESEVTDYESQTGYNDDEIEETAESSLQQEFVRSVVLL